MSWLGLVLLLAMVGTHFFMSREHGHCRSGKDGVEPEHKV